MEDRGYIRQKRGIGNARKIACVSVEQSEVQSVIITDGFGEVMLSLGSSSYPAGMTPDQAELIASELMASADRVRKAL